MACGIYSYIDLKTMEILYIGQSRNIYQRHRGHFHGKQPIDKLIKTDPIRYQLKIECKCLTDELNDKEQYYIELYSPKYNFTKGGDYTYSAMSKGNKYTFWNTSKVYYVSHKNQKRNKPFRLYYKGEYINCGYFEDWISAEIIWDLIDKEQER